MADDVQQPSNPSASRPTCTLTPIDLTNPEEFAELLHQRTVCGWLRTPSDLNNWQSQILAGTKILFWLSLVHRQSDPSSPSVTTTPRIGHAALDYTHTPPKPTWAIPDRSLIMISNVFILPEHRGNGAGRATMDALEAAVQTEPWGSKDCKAVTLTTTSRRYNEDEGPEWRGLFARLSPQDGHLGPGEKGRSNEDWYARRGYVKIWEGGLFPALLRDGTESKFIGVLMRKDLRT